MSKEIDQRIVEMRFDNKQFEQNTAQTMATLDKLKYKLNLDGASKGLENVGSAAKKVDMGVLGGAVETVRSKFSALEVMGVTALANITNSAVNTGKKISAALTIDPIKTGFNEYETKINAVQTIMSNTASKGTTMNDVTRTLDELNTYADKTIYNFAEMTRNIGTFTAAGVGLEDSASAIQGIANLAAASGSNSQQASTAMYQLSQALAAGTVKLMDWNSVVNAGMGGQKFQEALKETAREMGVNVDAMIKKNGSFRDSLQDGWLSADVLNTTLKKFTVDGAKEYANAMVESGKYTKEQADALIKESHAMEDAATKVKTFTQLWDTLKESAQSGWARTWEIIVGDFGEAKESLTELSNAFGGIIEATSEARNNVLSGGLSSGWKQLLDAGIADEQGYVDALKEIAGEHGDSFDKMIEDADSFEDALKQGLGDGTITADMMSEAVSKLAGKMKNMSEEELEAAGYTKEYVKEITELEKGLKNGTISMEEFVEKIQSPSGRENILQSLLNTFKGIMSIINPIKEAFTDVFPPITAERLYDLTESLRTLTERFKLSDETSKNLRSTFKGLFSILSIIAKAITAVVKGVMSLFDGVGNLGKSILGVTGSWGEWLFALNESIESSNIFNKVVSGIVNVIKMVVTAIKNVVTAIVDFVKGLKIFETIHALFERLHERMSGVKDGAVGIGDAFKQMGEAIMNSSLFKFLQSIFDLVKRLVEGVMNALGGLGKSLFESFDNANFSNILDLLNSVSFGAIAVGISKFVGSFGKALDGISDIKDSFIGILDGVRGCFEAYQSQLKAGVIMKIAIAIAILVAALAVLSMIDSDKLSASLGAVTVLFADLMGSLAVFNKIGGQATGVLKACFSMIAISTAVLILASALKKVASLEPDRLESGLVGIIVLTGVVVAAAKILSSGEKKVIKGAVQMLIFAAAVKVLASVCKDLSTLNWEELAKGLVGVGVLLAEVALFMRFAKFNGKSMSTAIGILILSAALKVLASVCKVFALMSWEELAKGLVAIGILLAEIVAFTKLTSNAKKVLASGVALIAVGAAMKIFASAIGDLGKLSWESIAKGLVAIAGALLVVTLSMRAMPKNMVKSAIGLIGVGAAITIIAEALKNMGGMSWEGIAKGLVTLAGSMLILAVGLNAMKSTLPGAAALIVAAVALAVLAPVLAFLGAMSWEAIAKGLVAIAGAFAILGIAGLVLKPLVPTILALSAALLLIGIAVAAAGVGIAAFAVGLGLLAAAGASGAAAIVYAIQLIITAIAELIPFIATKIGEAIVAFCKAIADGAVAIGDAIKTVVLTIIDVLVECIPAIVDGAMKLLTGVLDALVQYTPQIVDKLFQFIIGLLEGVARNLPSLIQAGVDVLMAFFVGVVDALKGIDTTTLIEGLVGVGILAGLMVALGAIASLIPGAMIGVLGMGIVLAELALVLAAVGALAQIPGLSWLIGEGGKLLQAVGTAIGQFIGGIVGGIMSGITSNLPQVGTHLSEFMDNIKPFIDGATSLDASSLDGVKALAEVILILTAANILDGITSWITGGSSLAQFGEELASFGPHLTEFSNSISGVNQQAITSAANATKTLAEMAATIPNSGGLVGLITGENSLADFGTELASFGPHLKEFSDSINGINGDSIVAAAEATKSLTAMAGTIPNSGGLVGLITGENSLAGFGAELASFGPHLKEFSDSVVGISPDAIVAAATATESLTAMAATIPNSGGLVGLITGENSLAAFGAELASFGPHLQTFSTYASMANPEAIFKAAIATRALTAMAASIPNSGGLVALVTGDNSLAEFGAELEKFGPYLQIFSSYASSINPEAIYNAALATRALTAMAASVPDSGGLVSLVTGENSLADFGAELERFGPSLASFSNYAALVNPVAVMGAAIATKYLTEMAAAVPNSGGLVDLITGDNSLAEFGAELALFGPSLVTFSNSATQIDAAAITTAVEATTTLVDMAAKIPDTGGLVSLITGDNSLLDFGTQLADFGPLLADFSKSVSEVNTEAITEAVGATQTMVDLASILPNSGGIVSWWEGDNNIEDFGKNLSGFGEHLKTFSDTVSTVNLSGVSSTREELEKLIAIAKDSSGIDFGGLSSFGNALKTLGETGIKEFVGAFENAESKVKQAGQKMVETFAKGLKDKKMAINMAIISLMVQATTMIRVHYQNFYDAGAYCMEGLAAGISAEKKNVVNAAIAVAQAAVDAANEVYDNNSPSKVFYQIGSFAGQGLVNSLYDYADASYKAGAEMAGSATTGLQRAIKGVWDIVDSDMNIQPTISPVLDLTDVRSGANSIASMFGFDTRVGVLASVGAINSSMNDRVQNGSDTELISAINKLRGDLGKVGNTYNSINGITYDDGSNITQAIQAIVKEAKVARRK